MQALRSAAHVSVVGCGPGQQRGAQNYGYEGCNTRNPERASGQRLSEDDHPGCDRERIRPQSRHAGSRQRTAPLESELQRNVPAS